MPVLSAYIVPHPPLIIPEVGRGEQLKIKSTIDSYEIIAKEIAAQAPDTIVFITPHSACYADYIHISRGLSAEGDFCRFGAKDVSFGIMYENKIVYDVTDECKKRGISAGNFGGEGNEALDHGVMVPLYFIHKYFQDFKCIRISISRVSYNEHYTLGKTVSEILDKFYRNTVVIASGDLSHKLIHDGPYGYSEAGPKFDNKICSIIKNGNLHEFMSFTEKESNDAAECGLRAFIIMAGMINGKTTESSLLSYEGPFGVGYAVGRFSV